MSVSNCGNERVPWAFEQNSQEETLKILEDPEFAVKMVEKRSKKTSGLEIMEKLCEENDLKMRYNYVEDEIVFTEKQSIEKFLTE